MIPYLVTKAPYLPIELITLVPMRHHPDCNLDDSPLGCYLPALATDEPSRTEILTHGSRQNAKWTKPRDGPPRSLKTFWRIRLH
jgi:hypothetical protein